MGVVEGADFSLAQTVALAMASISVLKPMILRVEICLCQPVFERLIATQALVLWDFLWIMLSIMSAFLFAFQDECDTLNTVYRCINVLIQCVKPNVRTFKCQPQQW